MGNKRNYRNKNCKMTFRSYDGYDSWLTLERCKFAFPIGGPRTITSWCVGGLVNEAPQTSHLRRHQEGRVCTKNHSLLITISKCHFSPNAACLQCCKLILEMALAGNACVHPSFTQGLQPGPAIKKHEH